MEESGTRIDSIEVVAARVSPPPERAALRALQGEWVFVLARGSGLTGVGEATHNGDDDALASLILHNLAPALAGTRLTLDRSGAQSPAGLLRRWFGDVSSGDRVFASALSALEQALWDLAARSAGIPLYQALSAGAKAHSEPQPVTGGSDSRPTIPLYATLNRGIFDRSPDGFASAGRQAVSDGFRAVKCAPFDGVVHGGSQDAIERERLFRVALDRVASVRAAVGPAVDIMVDCHGRLLEHEAVRFASLAEPYRLRWLEEPVPFDPDPTALSRVRQEVDVPIAAGELMFGVERFRPLFDAGAVDVVMPDVKHCGGLDEAIRIAGLAAEHGVAVAPHNPSGPISTLASAHLCAALSNAPLLEFAWGEVPWRPTLLTPSERVEAGHLVLTHGPGLGASLDPKTIARHQHHLGG